MCCRPRNWRNKQTDKIVTLGTKKPDLVKGRVFYFEPQNEEFRSRAALCGRHSLAGTEAGPTQLITGSYAALETLTAQTLYSGIPEIGSRAALVRRLAAAAA